MIPGADVSHFQGSPNFVQVGASGRAFVVLKATEGTTYVDPAFAANRKAAHAAGLIVGFYHFARAGDPVAEARWFLSTVGALQPGEFLVLDQEVPNTVGWCKTWLDMVKATTGVAPLIYMNQGSTTGLGMGNWAPVAASYGLWLARYDNAPDVITPVPYWGAPAMKQYSDKGTVPGIAGTCDVNVFYGSTAQLLAYGKGSATPQEVDLLPDERSALLYLRDAVLNGGKDASPSGRPLKDLIQAAADQTQAIYRPGDPNADANGLVALRQEVADAKTALQAMKATSAPVIDEAKLAAALLADPAAVQALGKAIANNLQLSPRA